MDGLGVGFRFRVREILISRKGIRVHRHIDVNVPLSPGHHLRARTHMRACARHSVCVRECKTCLHVSFAILSRESKHASRHVHRDAGTHTPCKAHTHTHTHTHTQYSLYVYHIYIHISISIHPYLCLFVYLSSTYTHTHIPPATNKRHRVPTGLAFSQSRIWQREKAGAYIIMSVWSICIPSRYFYKSVEI